ncbi:protease complex subunit PrcB family protein [Marinobacter subterrani]|uniref:PrcB C-terminal n=1 Tax=Marinobacter subterrani TaxID=1658765 RepID=A0A0J7JD08_9GAMM|nr:protease complex subunit PrcB family protein [Marinobacter subterrani]KMQ75744.1 PrcB C-terminal [Marinobacter subterrani]
MNMKYLIGSSLMAIGALGAGCAVSQTETATGAPLARQIAQSAHCGLTAPGHLLIGSVAQLVQLESLPERTLSLQPLRDIDFQREKVVLAAIGQKPTGGFGVTLQSSEIVDDTLNLTVRVMEPGPGAMVTQVLTTPCAVIAVAAEGWSDIRITRAENNR